MAKEDLIKVYSYEGKLSHDVRDLADEAAWQFNFLESDTKELEFRVTICKMAVADYINANYENLSQRQIKDLAKDHEFDLSEIGITYV